VSPCLVADVLSVARHIASRVRLKQNKARPAQVSNSSRLLPTHPVLHVTLQNVLLPRMPPSVHGIGRSPIVLGGRVTLHRSEWKDGAWACHALAYSSTRPRQSIIMLRTAIQSLGCLGLFDSMQTNRIVARRHRIDTTVHCC
jgi:hypothetical protein